MLGLERYLAFGPSGKGKQGVHKWAVAAIAGFLSPDHLAALFAARFFRVRNPLPEYFERRPELHPLKELLCRILPAQRDPDAAVGCRTIRNGAEPVDKIVARILDAVGHWGVVITSGVVHLLFLDDLILSIRGAVVHASADA